MVANKDALKKKRKLELVGSEEDSHDFSSNNFDVSSEAKQDKIPVIKEIDQNQRHNGYFDNKIQKP